ncbi:hypothetical protein [Streptomyces sp. HNM0574]|uniref:hypothetical protein n=1 Tax=Streptomyces sp. HNM0574 TaxID=2714954 RepID=UPI00146A9189|nr:hypothetical protein [Streptomyces sp. HNM0574]NLU69830.1 hypothetical protein [Streptomyces sp. HNM0574]
MTTHNPAARTVLDFHGTRLELLREPGAGIDGALRFLETHVVPAPAGDGDGPEPVATLRVHAPQPDGDPGRFTPSPGVHREDIHIRKSASEFFTVPARRAREEGREYLECTKTGSRFVFDAGARTVDVLAGPEGTMDVVELVRDLVLKHQENTGAAVLHATAAYRDGSAVLVTGAKGAGKSTVLLELVEHFGYEIMSGDKTLLHEQPDGTVLAAGWPDYPHLGYGTVAKYPGLREIAGLGDDYRPAGDHAFSPFGKFAVDPERFRERFPSAPLGTHVPVAAVVHPSIGPGDRTVLEPVGGSTEDRAAVFEANLESAFDGAHAGWNSYLPDGRAAQAARRGRILARLAAVPAWQLTGPGDLTPGNWPPRAGGPDGTHGGAA